MTYCVGLLLDAGLVFASDSRTNAGIDQVSSFRKMKVFERADDRIIVILSSGNLSITQNAITLLEQRVRRPELGPTIWDATSMFDVASLLGECLRDVRRRDATFLQESNVDAGASFILTGLGVSSSADRSRVSSRGSSSSTRKATSSRRPRRRPTSRPARPSTASR